MGDVVKRVRKGGGGVALTLTASMKPQAVAWGTVSPASVRAQCVLTAPPLTNILPKLLTFIHICVETQESDVGWHSEQTTPEPGLLLEAFSPKESTFMSY